MGRKGIRALDKPTEVSLSAVRQTERSLTEIEIALAESDYFNFVRNTVAFNVIGESARLPIFHECDMLVLRPSGYLIEVEIKRSWADFLADFKKEHHHGSYGNDNLIKELWFCLPLGCLNDARDKLIEHKQEYSGIVAYDEQLRLTFYGGVPMKTFRKLTPEECFQVARFGAMRCVSLRKKLIHRTTAAEQKLKQKVEDLKARESALVEYIKETTGEKLSRKELKEIYYG